MRHISIPAGLSVPAIGDEGHSPNLNFAELYGEDRFIVLSSHPDSCNGYFDESGSAYRLEFERPDEESDYGYFAIIEISDDHYVGASTAVRILVQTDYGAAPDYAGIGFVSQDASITGRSTQDRPISDAIAEAITDHFTDLMKADTVLGLKTGGRIGNALLPNNETMKEQFEMGLEYKKANPNATNIPDKPRVNQSASVSFHPYEHSPQGDKKIWLFVSKESFADDEEKFVIEWSRLSVVEGDPFFDTTKLMPSPGVMGVLSAGNNLISAVSRAEGLSFASFSEFPTLSTWGVNRNTKLEFSAYINPVNPQNLDPAEHDRMMDDVEIYVGLVPDSLVIENPTIDDDAVYPYERLVFVYSHQSISRFWLQGKSGNLTKTKVHARNAIAKLGFLRNLNGVVVREELAEWRRFVLSVGLLNSGFSIVGEPANKLFFGIRIKDPMMRVYVKGISLYDTVF